MCIGCTMQPCPDTDGVFRVEPISDFGRITSCKVERQDTGEHSGVGRAVETDAGQGAQSIQQVRQEFGFVSTHVVEACFPEKGDTGMQAGQSRQIGGAAFQAFGEMFRSQGGGGISSAAAINQRCRLQPFPYVKQTATGGTHEMFVARGCQQIDAHGLNIDGKVAGGLCCIDQQQDALVAAPWTQVFDGLDAAADIGGVSKYNHAGSLQIVHHRFTHVCRMQPPVRAGGDFDDLYATGLQGVQRSYHGVVLHGRGDDPVAGIEQAEKRQIYGFRCIGGEDHACGVADAEHFRHTFAGIQELAAGIQRHAVTAAPRAASQIAQGMIGGPVDRLWLGEGSRSVIEVDRHRASSSD